VSTKSATKKGIDLKDVSQATARKSFIWLNSKRQELTVYRVPIKHLYFNIENGRYADKMIELKEKNPGVEIDPREDKWKDEIYKMLKGDLGDNPKDRDAFELLSKDLLAREQLQPGVALPDGGVLDGNRRFAVLRYLYDTQQNPGRFEYLDAVILPENVGSKDRWRIEAGLQIGKDEKLDYSPINRLLKIKEGLDVFSDTNDPALEIANTLIGISKPEVERDIEKIKLIDQYLTFIGKPKAYNLLSDVVERFEEALNSMESAKREKLKPLQVAALKMKLFLVIRAKAMTNWQMRDIRLAIGAPGKKARRYKNEKVLNQFLELPAPIAELQKALKTPEGTAKLVEQEKETSKNFLDAMDATKSIDEPARLANKAVTNLEQLIITLEDGSFTHHAGWQKTVDALLSSMSDVKKHSDKCTALAQALKKKKAKGSP
jgi:hypothetical protein